MHPLTWAMFVKDATLRHFVLMSGGGTFFANWSGSAQQNSLGATQGGMGMSGGLNFTPAGNAAGLSPTALSALDPQQNSAPVLPGYFGINFQIIVSPYVPFDPRRLLTHIYIFDRSELGVLVVDEE